MKNGFKGFLTGVLLCILVLILEFIIMPLVFRDSSADFGRGVFKEVHFCVENTWTPVDSEPGRYVVLKEGKPEPLCYFFKSYSMLLSTWILNFPIPFNPYVMIFTVPLNIIFYGFIGYFIEIFYKKIFLRKEE